MQNRRFVIMFDCFSLVWDVMMNLGLLYEKGGGFRSEWLAVLIG